MWVEERLWIFDVNLRFGVKNCSKNLDELNLNK